MKTTVKRLLSALLAIGLFVVVSCEKKEDKAAAQAAPKAKKIILKTPIAFNTNLPGLGTTIQYVSDIVKEMTDGNLEIKIFQPGELVQAFEILDSVSTGKVQAGYATPGYWAGTMPAAPLFSAVPFGPEAGEYLAWFYFGDGMKLYQRMYDEKGYNVKVLQCGMIAPETSGWYSKEMNEPEDLKGLKIRFFGLGGQVLEKLGAAVQLLPGGEIFPALEKKALDATEFSMPAIDVKLGFYKIVKYNYFPGWHQQATSFELLINKDTWNGLSASHQKIIEYACQAGSANSIAEGEALQFAVMKENVETRGVKIKKWNDKMLETFRKTWEEVAKEQSENDAYFKEVYDNMQTFHEGYEIWESTAFLPRKELED